MIAVARVTAAQAEEIAHAHYGFRGSAQRLAAEHDDVFRVVAGDGSSRLLRVSAAAGRPGGAGRAGGAGLGVPAGGISLQAAILLHLASAAPRLPVQRVITSLDGRPEVILPGSALPGVAPDGPALDGVAVPGMAPGESGRPRLVRMTSWLDGDPLGKETVGHGLRIDIGATLARLSMALRGFSHPDARRTHWWDLQQLGRLRPLLGDLPPGGVLPEVRAALSAGGPALEALAAGGGRAGSDGADGPDGPDGANGPDGRDRTGAAGEPGRPGGAGRPDGPDGAGGAGAMDGPGGAWALDGPGGAGGLSKALGDYLDHFDAVVRPRLARVPVQVIHTDFHGLNLLGDGERVTGILDFGDALAGPVAMDVAVAACYQLGPGADPLAPALDVVAGYHAVDPLDGADLELAAEFIVARVVARIIVSQWNALREPANRGYLLRRTPQAIEHYTALRRVGTSEIAARLRAACP